MSAFSPEPWQVRRLDLFEGGEGVEIVASDGETVADNQTYYPHALDAKNASLIAAAPDLLRVAELALSMILEECADAEHADQVFQLRAAIAKAKGEA